jgi:nucleotide-binding universal stress UspA family protein
MPIILRPTRGGEASYPNQDRSIAIAKERDADLLFLYVANARFLDHFASAILVDVETELEGMGEFLLCMAQERAEQAGVHAETVVLRGEFREALEEVIREHDEISTLVVGTAAGETGVTSPGYLEDLIKWVLNEFGIEVIVVHDGEIAEQHVPE